ncbi:NUDIX hydrolase domain-like protein [Flagelloscypha sp. PMI_526]|nr:NUDIX hydrolase domain-like protein [Flagelloscypha sp. PMI_526]
MASPSNYFGGSPLNRLSWLRSKSAFLNAIVESPSSKWLVFNAGQPLVSDSRIAYLSTEEVKPFIGSQPWFGQNAEPTDLLLAEDEHTEAIRHTGISIVFLGLHEPENATTALPETEFIDASSAVKKLEGNPYFTIDLSELPDNQAQEAIQRIQASKEGQNMTWSEPRSMMSSMNIFDAAVYAEARSMVDWIQRNRFCAGCGTPVATLWGGWKLVCRSLLPWVDKTGKKPCPTTRGLHNFTHPRTDPVVIMAAIDETGEKILLGHSKKFPVIFYSALAGFIEPGETFEDAVKREMWEEAGVRVWDVTYHSTQPWPYPANLMVGFFARADSSKPIRTDLDNELADAKWFSRQEIQAIVAHPTAGGPLTRQELQRYEENQQLGKHLAPSDSSTAQQRPPTSGLKPDQAPFRIPPATAIAGVLIRDWASGKFNVGAVNVSSLPVKGNL